MEPTPLPQPASSSPDQRGCLPLIIKYPLLFLFFASLTHQGAVAIVLVALFISFVEKKMGWAGVGDEGKKKIGIGCYGCSVVSMFVEGCLFIQVGFFVAGLILAGLEPIADVIRRVRRYLVSLNADRWVDLFGGFIMLVGALMVVLGVCSGVGVSITWSQISIGVWSGKPSQVGGVFLFLGLGTFLCLLGNGIRRRLVWAGALGLCLTFSGFISSVSQAFSHSQGDLSRLPEGFVQNGFGIFLNWGFFFGFYSVFYPMVSNKAREFVGPLEAQVQQVKDALHAAQEKLNRAENQAAKTSLDLEYEKTKYKAVFESINEGVVIFDPNDIILYLNPAYCSFYGINREEWEGKSWIPIFSRPGIECVSTSHMDEKDPAEVSARVTQGEVIIRDEKGGIRRWLAFYSKPIYDREGLSQVFVGLSRDVTLEKEIDRVKTEFVSNVSHELRTPLTSIRAYTEMLLDDEAEDPQTRKDYLQIILDEAERLTNLINDILDLSRMESGRKAYRFGEHDPGLILKKVLSVSQSFAEKKNQTLTMELTDQLGKVLCDPDLLHQSVLNLVNNAIKYTPEGGKIELHLKPLEEKYRIEVTDTGPGIPEDDQKKLFSKFFRVESSLNREIGGTGLGLALVKQIAMVHQGNVGVISTPGKGATFFLELPCRFNPLI